MDFYRIAERSPKKGEVDIFPDFKVIRSKDLMIRGRSFYAIWDEKKGLWSTDEYDVQRLIDEKLYEYLDARPKTDENPTVKALGNFSSNSWLQFRNYIGHLSDSSTQLDEVLTFANSEVKKDDYVSRRLPYPLAPGDYSAWDELVGVLYEPSERAKLEWAIGAIVAGDAKHIQKFLVLYGSAGTGKSTILNIVQWLFEGYYTTFEAKALTGASNAFSTEVFKTNPLVAIQHDGDLSKIEDNTKLNSIISHEEMTLNEKYKPSYMARINAFLFMGTNKPVKITDAKSGIIRRLIDVRPTGEKIPSKHYQALIAQVKFQLGAIAHHCMTVYQEMGKDYYAGYRPLEMMLQTDVFFNFIEANYDIFKAQNGTSLKQAYDLYKEYCNETLIDWKLPQYKFREELKNYFDEYHDRFYLEDGTRARSWFHGFHAQHFKTTKVIEERNNESVFSLVMDDEVSLLDKMLADQPAQYASKSETPVRKWDEVATTLSDLDTHELHYVRPGPQHIVIDFDLKDSDGNKSAERNLEAASGWPPTYAEYSKGGGGVHLHYIWEGDVDDLARVYDEGIEIKVFTGNSSLRRRLSRCNNVPVAHINSGLPLREKKMINTDTIKTEVGLRNLIMRNLRKEIHPSTKPSVDFIHKILEEAYESGISYDVTDMRGKILSFANNSSNQALQCIKMIQTMQFKSDDVIEEAPVLPKDERLVIFDVEVFPNLFVVCWKYQGSTEVVRMINPSAHAVSELFSMKLVGYNCRRYDNHMLYAASMGYNNEQLYKLSKKLITEGVGYFGEAYNISYADIYDYASKKQSLKKWEVELDIPHKEWGGGWDDPVDEKDWPEVADYCANDVDATDAVLEATKQDLVAREILADLSGLPINATTQQHTSKIVFGDDKKPQEQFVYTDLSEMFPGYKFELGKSHYRGEITGEGGYVYAEPGMYENVALLDVASMHPTSIEALDLFGKEYTENFAQLKRARLAIKRGDFDSAKKMLGGKLARHLSGGEEAAALSYALKIVINIVYGLTSARFDNAFKDPRNIDNIVAKRGALFMVDLKAFVQGKGFTVAHIKTDSIKIPNATPEIIHDVMEFGQMYGYEFEHEETYEKMALVNDAVYIAKTRDGKWSATGAQFAHPYVFKTLFSGEQVRFKDMCETKQVTTALYLDFDAEDTPGVLSGKPRFVGKIGSFVPIKPGCGGGVLYREKDGKFHAATGSKGYFWMESEMVEKLSKQPDVDKSYFEKLVYDARAQLAKYGDVEWFLS